MPCVCAPGTHLDSCSNDLAKTGTTNEDSMVPLPRPVAQVRGAEGQRLGSDTLVVIALPDRYDESCAPYCSHIP